MVMSAAHAVDTDIGDARWKCVSSMLVSGHVLQNDGGIDECLERTLKHAWRAFYANCSGRVIKNVPVNCKLRLLKACVGPIIDYRCSRWPFTITHAKRLDALQRNMLATILDIWTSSQVLATQRNHSLKNFVGLRPLSNVPKANGVCVGRCVYVIGTRTFIGNAMTDVGVLCYLVYNRPSFCKSNVVAMAALVPVFSQVSARLAGRSP